MAVQHINPDTMYHSPVFSQGIIIPSNARILLIGGQNGVDEKGEVVDKTDMGKQTAQALVNLQKVLTVAGANLEDLVKVSIIMRSDADLRAGFGEWMKVWGARANPPVVTSLRVPELANPDFLIEIEAQAVLP
ncbi:Enamine deaminase RidA, house cleaning of reactive enamine intermediates, YjgF/YER057c/UK114 family [Devosia sp. YR412]|uniref:RidA family protein n=1 Tax=Devosia sp. YR412 TaxID=1881030 RepID=UPI0008B2714F|nr:RidA family protein [Devosia sp. YR412]SEQ00589.1 Enamine deaminase RidA, house cleaning of reactive enamine intermediates, YjgF/YER057c/UK114 family [Devosia sp. YR412]